MLRNGFHGVKHGIGDLLQELQNGGSGLSSGRRVQREVSFFL
jgi:hypothetical protein